MFKECSIIKKNIVGERKRVIMSRYKSHKNSADKGGVENDKASVTFLTKILPQVITALLTAVIMTVVSSLINVKLVSKDIEYIKTELSVVKQDINDKIDKGNSAIQTDISGAKNDIGNLNQIVTDQIVQIARIDERIKALERNLNVNTENMIWIESNEDILSKLKDSIENKKR